MITDKQGALNTLIRSNGGTHFSAYIPQGDSERPLKEQLKEHIAEAKKQLRYVQTPEESSQFFKPLESLLNDERMLPLLQGNVAVYRNANSFRVLKIPIHIRPQLILSNTFHVKPLLKWMQSDRDFLLVGLENNKCHIYSGNQFSLKRIASFDYSSTRMTELALMIDDRVGDFVSGYQPSMYIVGNEFQRHALETELSYSEKAPNIYNKTFDPAMLSEISSLIRSHLQARNEKDYQLSLLEFKYADRLELAERNLFEIAKAAVQGRVKKLLVVEDIHIFGKLNSKTGEVRLQPERDHEDDDVLDDLAQVVLSHGGQVLVVPREDILGDCPMLALVQVADPEMRFHVSSKEGVYTSRALIEKIRL